MNASSIKVLTVASAIIVMLGSIDALRGAGQHADEDKAQDDTAQNAEQQKSNQPKLFPKASETVVTKTNDFRRENGLEAVTQNKALQRAAEKFAVFMARTEKYGHYADGQRPSARAEAAGYQYCVVRENIAYRLNTARPAAETVGTFFVNGWIDSEDHRENMLAKHVTETGVGVASEDGATFFAVQLFGRPESAKYQIKITNELNSPQTVIFLSEDNRDELTIPPQVVLSMSRCVPTKVKLDNKKAGDGQNSVDVNSSLNLMITQNPEGKVQIVREDS